MKNRNPVDSVRFFSRYDDKNSFSIPKETVSLLIPDVFEEKILRIFVRDKKNVRKEQKKKKGGQKQLSSKSENTKKKKKVSAAQSAFRSFLRKNGLKPDLFSKAYLSPNKEANYTTSSQQLLAPPARVASGCVKR